MCSTQVAEAESIPSQSVIGPSGRMLDATRPSRAPGGGGLVSDVTECQPRLAR